MNRAFSLVELSIVLVILGLITGGILAGQSLIRGAELRSVVTEHSNIMNAYNIFVDKYQDFPGDMSDAEDYWGTMSSGTCPNATGGVETETCNGDGNGVIQVASAHSRTGESFTFWQHLANAGLIDGSYTGIAGSDTWGHSTILGENTPESKIDNVGWSVHPHGDYTGVNNSVVFATDHGNNLTMGANVTSGINEQRAFTPKEVWSIDSKVDDGKPGTGKMIVRFWDACTTAATNGHTNVNDRIGAEYLLSETSEQCSIYFPKSFGQW